MSDLANALGVQDPTLTSKVTVVRTRKQAQDLVTKREGELLHSNSLNVEDDRSTVFEGLGRGKIVKPTYDPVLLSVLVQQNNTLMQCVTAMEVNIDGTGYEIERLDGEPKTEEDNKKVGLLKQFFDEPYPGESFVTQRRQLRRDLESTGCGYIEVLRSQAGEMMFLRRLDSKLMRLVTLDEPTLVSKTVNRMGKQVPVRMLERERRFAMQVGNKVRFFKEFGASREIDLRTGEWVGQPETAVIPLPSREPRPEDRTPGAAKARNDDARYFGTEVIYLTVFPDVHTGYGVPRWINQVPSVLGSRKAEEFNLDFFDAGGLPPAIILVQGGQLEAGSKRSLTNYLAGKSKYKQRGVIAEVFAAGGSLDSNSNVKVTVERFGAERQSDAMFQTYDKNCGDHVRRAFRLPPLFLGQSQDQNYATAIASYMVAEAQVFRPEREEFDEVINVHVMKELAPEFYFRSLPLQVNDVDQQIKALEMAKDMSDPEEFLRTLNEIASLTLTLKEEDTDQESLTALVRQLAGLRQPENKDPGDVVVEANDKGLIAKMDDGVLSELAEDWSQHLTGAQDFEPASVKTMHTLIKSLAPQVRTLFNRYVAMKMANPSNDLEGTAALLSAAGECKHRPSDPDCN